jgi:hypothetical protein
VRAFEIRDVRVGNDVLDTAGFGVSGDISVLSGKAGLHTGACEVNGSRDFKSALGGKIHAFTAGFQVPPRILIFSLWMNVSPVTTVDPSVRFVKTRGILSMSIKQHNISNGHPARGGSYPCKTKATPTRGSLEIVLNSVK